MNKDSSEDFCSVMKSLPLIKTYGGHLLLIGADQDVGPKALGYADEVDAYALISEGRLGSPGRFLLGDLPMGTEGRNPV
jgi:hypothetical protein